MSESTPAPESADEDNPPEVKDRWPVTAYLDGALHAELRIAAARAGHSMATWVRIAIQDRVLETSVTPNPKKSLKGKLQDFLAFLAEHFHLGQAAHLAGVPRTKLFEWTQDDQIRNSISFHQSLYMEKVERQMIEIGEGKRKGCFQALCAFLNAHHPQYGIKAELLARIMGDVIERFGKVVSDHFNDTQAQTIIRLLKEQADKKVLQFK